MVAVLMKGSPRTIRISSNEVLEALVSPLSEIVIVVKEALEQTPPELSADLSRRGIMFVRRQRRAARHRPPAHGRNWAYSPNRRCTT